ncbi:hypothetical protein [Nonomuraea dietziae]|uniref:Uncharacterized protein n=1 Tax=Nonomuraea dietziae TaxID=65515 RepID=A0A7W5VI33_9ACTN|nr:hypothetical protein [Nonomuraea dietziae]MBB3734000.1 hypothetical protein [Nonomuraea dietziae]
MSADRPTRDPVDITVDACTRFAAHLMLLSRQFGEHGLDDGERERLAAALAISGRALTTAAAAAAAAGGGLPNTTPPT